MWFIVRLVSEPDHSHGEEGSGNMPAFALSPGSHADLKIWKSLMANDIMEMVFLQVSSVPSDQIQ